MSVVTSVTEGLRLDFLGHNYGEHRVGSFVVDYPRELMMRYRPSTTTRECSHKHHKSSINYNKIYWLFT